MRSRSYFDPSFDCFRELSSGDARISLENPGSEDDIGLRQDTDTIDSLNMDGKFFSFFFFFRSRFVYAVKKKQDNVE